MKVTVTYPDGHQYLIDDAGSKLNAIRLIESDISQYESRFGVKLKKLNMKVGKSDITCTPEFEDASKT